MARSYALRGDTLLKWGSLAALAASAAMLALVVGYIISEARIPPSPDVTLFGFLWGDNWDPSGRPSQLGNGPVVALETRQRQSECMMQPGVPW